MEKNKDLFFKDRLDKYIIVWTALSIFWLFFMMFFIYFSYIFSSISKNFSPQKTDIFPFMFIIGILIIFFIGFMISYLAYKRKLMITPEGIVHIPGFNLFKSKINLENSYYYSEQSRIKFSIGENPNILDQPDFRINFSIFNIKDIRLLTKKEKEEINKNMSKLFTIEKDVLIEFKKPLRNIINPVKRSIINKKELDKIYLSLAEPEKFVYEIKKRIK